MGIAGSTGVSEGVRRAATALRAAEDELQAALAVALDRRCRVPQSTLHVVRAWQALAEALPRSPCGESPPGAPLAARIDADVIDHIRGAECAEWERSLAAMVAATGRPPGADGDAAGPGREDVLRHCRWLEQALRKAKRRAGARREGPRALGAAAPWVVAAVLVAAAGSLFLGGRTRGPWRAAYYENVDLKGDPVWRTDEDVFFDWGDGAPLPSFPSDDFSASWETCLRLEKPVRSRFVLGSDDGSRLFVDGNLLVDNWGPHDFRIASGERRIEAGRHLLRVEFFDKAGAARVALRAGFDSAPLAPIPAVDLSAPEVSANGAARCAGG